MLASGTKISELKTTIGSIAGSLKEAARVVEKERDMKKAQGTIQISGSRPKDVSR